MAAPLQEPYTPQHAPSLGHDKIKHTHTAPTTQARGGAHVCDEGAQRKEGLHHLHQQVHGNGVESVGAVGVLGQVDQYWSEA